MTETVLALFIGGGPSDTKFGGERGKVILVTRAEKMGNESAKMLKREIPTVAE